MRRAVADLGANDKDRNFVTALARGLDILRCFGPSDEYLGNAELAKRTSIPRPTVSRMTATLTQLGYLRYVPQLEKYRLGPGVLDLGYRYLASEGVRDLARPYMQELADSTDCMVAIGAPDGAQVTYIQVCQGGGPLVLRLDIGSRVPMATSALGGPFWPPPRWPSGKCTTSRFASRTRPPGPRWSAACRMPMTNTNSTGSVPLTGNGTGMSVVWLCR